MVTDQESTEKYSSLEHTPHALYLACSIVHGVQALNCKTLGNTYLAQQQVVSSNLPSSDTYVGTHLYSLHFGGRLSSMSTLLTRKYLHVDKMA